MKASEKLLVGLATGAIASMSAVSPVQALLVSQYDFNNSFADSLGNSPDLNPLGGTLGASTYTFDANQGVTLSNAAIFNDNYTILLDVAISTTNSFRKFIDFKDRSSDNGLYNINGQLRFFPVSASPSVVILPDVSNRIVLTRDNFNSEIVGYVNGVQNFSFIDNSDIGVFNTPTTNILRFLQDDNVTAFEASGGVLDTIALWNTALTPTEVANINLTSTPVPFEFNPAIGLGLLGGAWLGQKVLKKKS